MPGRFLSTRTGSSRRSKNAERGAIVDQDAAIAIEHAATRGDNRNGANAIAFGHRGIFFGVNDLKLPEAEEQHADHAHDDVGSHGETALRQTIVVAKQYETKTPRANF